MFVVGLTRVGSLSLVPDLSAPTFLGLSPKLPPINFVHAGAYPVASLRLVSPGAVTDGVTFSPQELMTLVITNRGNRLSHALVNI